MSEFEKLKELKVGDNVIVSKRYFGESVNSVTRITNHQILVCGIPYWKENGKEVGGSSYLLIATEERIKQIEDRKKEKDLCAFLNMTRWEDLSLESLKTIVDCVRSEFTKQLTHKRIKIEDKYNSAEEQ